MKRKRSIDFLATVLLIGVVLSFSLYIGLGSAWNGSGVTAVQNWNAAFYQDGAIGYFVKYCDYRLFRHVDDETILVGREDWLFETEAENGYPYLLDYVGGCPYSETELETICRALLAKQQAYRAMGTEYILVVVPNAMTVCQTYLPEYLGTQSESTRLRVLSRYLSEQGVTCFLDPLLAMQNEQTVRDLYNNTEDSLNAYGAYTLYNEMMDRLASYGWDCEAYRLKEEELDFSVRATEGKAIAKKAGLSRIISNRTVSLTERMTESYSMAEVTEYGVRTVQNRQNSGYPAKVVLALSEEWDKIQLMPYISNTFEEVVYEISSGDDFTLPVQQEGAVFIQVIHERDLDCLLS